MSSPIDIWHSLLREVDAPALCSSLAERMQMRRLHFGGRPLCPFLRPFFLDAADEDRVRHAAETLWRLGERVARVAIDRPDLLQQLALSDAEIRLARIDPGYETTSTAARADAFVLPDSLQFAEYNGESPAGAGYSQGLAEVFDGEPLMARFRERFVVRMYRPVEALLEALVASYREWGGTASPPLMAIVDWREGPTYSEFEIMRDLFSADEREVIRRHIPWTVVVEERRVTRDGQAIDLLPHLRRHRDRFVIKPNDEYGGTGVTLGWETTEAEWDAAIARALAERDRGWVAQEQIKVRREVFPICENDLAMRDMLVDFAPYLFRGRLAGFLTRLSATGLANVTSGGGQVPAFVVSRR